MHSRPLISIIIPVHNRLDLTSDCLNSISKWDDRKFDYEIILVDDASTDQTVEWVSKNHPAVRVIKNQERKSFAQNMNIASRLARGEFLCLLNNDTIVLRDWLRPLVEALQTDPNVAVAGNRQITPGTDKINHGGMAFDHGGEPLHIYVNKPRDYPNALDTREFQALTAACWLVPAKIFSQLNGFDENFKNGYEDVDFCLRARQLGLKVLYVGKSVIYHYGQSTPGRKTNDSNNSRYFHQKWRGHLIPDIHRYLKTPVWKGRKFSRRSHIVSPKFDADIFFSIPLGAGNAFSWVTAKLALACEEIGIKSSIENGPINHSIDESDRRALRKLMSRTPSSRFQIRWGHFWEPYINRPLNGEINAEIIALNYRYGRQKRNELDFWMRHTILNTYAKLPVSEYCANSLRDLGVQKNLTFTLHHGYSPEAIIGNETDSRFDSYEFVFLAVTNSHDPFRYGTDILLRSYEKAFSGNKKVCLVLKDYGKNASQIDAWVKDSARNANIHHLREFVNKNELMALYRRADAFVAPFRGEGFGMKILDACALGIPVIAPAYGGPLDFLTRGDFYDVAFQTVTVGECSDSAETVVPPFATWCEPSEDDLAEKMLKSFDDAKLGVRIGQNTKSRVIESFSWRSAAENIIPITENLRETRQTAAARRTRTKSDKLLSVIMPTFRRPAELRKTLLGYIDQSLQKEKWEIIIVDDCSGDDYKTSQIISDFSILPIKFIPLSENGGAGRARNIALEHACGDFILFTGDDIFPDKNLLAEHVHALSGLAGENAAILGHIGWDKEIDVSELMDYITSDGGHQFAYKHMAAYEKVNPLNFYTSNVSIPRDILAKQQTFFSDNFKGYGLEDSELGARLGSAGLSLYYNPDAIGYHNHPMTDEYIFQRQYNVGKALVTFYAMHPNLMSTDALSRIKILEVVQKASQLGETFASDKFDLDFDSAFKRLQDNAQISANVRHRVDRVLNGRPRRQLATISNEDLASASKQSFADRLALAELCGLADGWFGARSGAAEAAKFLLCEEHARWRANVGHTSTSMGQMSGLKKRVEYVDRLKYTHPVTASALGALVKLATGVAKRVEKKSLKKPAL